MHVSKPCRITQEQIHLFAKASGGYGKIHVDTEHAKKTKFKTTLAHGFHLVAMIEKELNDLDPNWSANGELEVKFVKPVKVDQEFTICFEPNSLKEQVKVEVKSEEEGVLIVGTATIQ